MIHPAEEEVEIEEKDEKKERDSGGERRKKWMVEKGGRKKWRWRRRWKWRRRRRWKMVRSKAFQGHLPSVVRRRPCRGKDSNDCVCLHVCSIFFTSIFFTGTKNVFVSLGPQNYFPKLNRDRTDWVASTTNCAP